MEVTTLMFSFHFDNNLKFKILRVQKYKKYFELQSELDYFPNPCPGPELQMIDR